MISQHLTNVKLGYFIFLDLEKALDTMGHGILLSKLVKCGMVGTPLQLFTSYRPLHSLCQWHGQRLKNCTSNKYANDTSATCSAEDINNIFDNVTILRNVYSLV